MTTFIPSFAASALAALLAACGGDGDGGNAGTPDNSLQAIATARADGTPQTDRPEVDAYVQAQLAQQHIPGASLAVTHDGQIVYAKSYGYADPASLAPMRPELRFDLASISKQFLAVSTLMLVEQGRLGLDDKIAAYLGNDGPPGWSDATIRELLSHTAGEPSLPLPAALMPPGTYNRDEAHGFGWFLHTLPNGDRVASHSGGLPGYSHEFVRYRPTRWSILVLTNLDEERDDPRPIAQQVGMLFGARA